jgi:voltage-gated potassium channel
MLRSAGIDTARAVVIMAHRDDIGLADSVTFDLLHRISELNCTGTIVAECVVDENRPRLRAAGADIVIRPMRAYPGMIVRALETPGSEQIIESAFRPDRGHFSRYDLPIDGLPWKEIVRRLADRGIGTPVGFVSSADRTVVSFPPMDDDVFAEALIIVDHDARRRDLDEIEGLLSEPLVR